MDNMAWSAGLATMIPYNNTVNVRVVAQGCGRFSRADLSAAWNLPMPESTPLKRSCRDLSENVVFKIDTRPVVEIRC